VAERQPGATDPARVGADRAASNDGAAGDDGAAGRFTVRLDNFTGPFDLLLQLISKHKLDVTEVALHQVTDEFLAYTRALGTAADLDETSEFLVVAATLLDLKAARLLPAAEVEDEEDLALLEARDLLFARLLQYQAFKQAAACLAELHAAGARRWPRAVSLEPRFAQALPELIIGVGPQRLAALAARVLHPKPAPVVSTDHVHHPRVSVREHAAALRRRLLRQRTATFRGLCTDCRNTLEVVARFLALLEMYREGLVAFDQVRALGELTVRWTGGDEPVVFDVDEYDTGRSDAGDYQGAARLEPLARERGEVGSEQPGIR
jgi:segregation and condensation protein A